MSLRVLITTASLSTPSTTLGTTAAYRFSSVNHNTMSTPIPTNTIKLLVGDDSGAIFNCCSGIGMYTSLCLEFSNNIQFVKILTLLTVCKICSHTGTQVTIVAVIIVVLILVIVGIVAGKLFSRRRYNNTITRVYIISDLFVFALRLSHQHECNKDYDVSFMMIVNFVASRECLDDQII